MTSDGNTYERHAIEEWLKNNDISPITKEKLDNKVLFPNPLVQKHILAHYRKYEANKGKEVGKSESNVANEVHKE
jgi:hypothetical protein